MSTAQTGGAACLSEDEVASYLAGNGPPPEVVTRHISGCTPCRLLVAEAARSVDSSTRSLGTATTLRPGELVDERYEVVRFIARGGMGEVYEARDKLLGTVVALKTLSFNILESGVAVARLKQEVLIARRITHPNVCRLFDFSAHRQDGPQGPVQIPVLTMELLQGQTLGERLREKGPFAVAAARPLLLQMVAGLGAVHAAGIVHRDFKSDNVFLVPSPGGGERVVVMDLGLARRQDLGGSGAVLTGGAVVGTLDYMAPEQLEGAPPGPGADVYALGVVMFEMITGKRPFAAATAIATALKRFREPAPLPSEAAAGVDASLDAIVMGCLEMDPARRTASVDDVRRALERPAAPPARRRRRWALLAAGVVVGGATAFGLVALRLGWAERPSAGAPQVQAVRLASEPPPREAERASPPREVEQAPPPREEQAPPPREPVAPRAEESASPPVAPARSVRHSAAHTADPARKARPATAVPAPAPGAPATPPRAVSGREQLLLDF
jgi:hypothetical protein